MTRKPLRERDWVVEVPHAKDCAARQAVEEGVWTTAWSLMDKHAPFDFGTPFGNLHAKRGRHAAFIRLRCNDIACPARLLVNLRRMLELIGAKR